MSYSSPEFDLIDQKDLEEDHELLKLKRKVGGQVIIVLSAKNSRNGAFFAGHNCEILGNLPGEVDKYYKTINSIDDFHQYSFEVRNRLQKLLEEGRI